MALAPTTACAGVTCAHLASAITQEALQHTVLNQDRALGRHALVVHGHGAKAVGAEPFVNGGHRRVGDGLANVVCKGGGAPLHLGGLQQMATGFMENDAPKRLANTTG